MYFLHLVPPFNPHYIIMVEGLFWPGDCYSGWYGISNSALLQPPKPSSGGMSGPSVSRLAEEVEEVLPDDQKSVFDWCKEGNATRLAAMVTEKNINKKDEQVSETQTLYHYDVISTK